MLVHQPPVACALRKYDESELLLQIWRKPTSASLPVWSCEAIQKTNLLLLTGSKFIFTESKVNKYSCYLNRDEKIPIVCNERHVFAVYVNIEAGGQYGADMV